MIYLASPYSHPDPLMMKTRFLLAEELVAAMLARGEFVYSPIVHCHELSQKYKLPTDFDYWSSYNRDMLRRCDVMYILNIPGWDKSVGVKGEFEFAKLCNLRVFLIDQDHLTFPELYKWPV